MHNRTIGFTILRVLIGLIIIKDFITYFFNRENLFGLHGIFPLTQYHKLLSFLSWSWSQMPFENPAFLNGFMIFAIIIAVAFTLGIYRVFTGLTVFAILMLLKLRNGYICDGGDNVIEAIVPFLTLAYSSPLVRVPSPKLGPTIKYWYNLISIFMSRGLLIQMCFVYFFAAFEKALSHDWQNGTALYYSLRAVDFRASSLNILLTSNKFIVYFITYFTIIWEFSFGIFVWFRQTRFYILLISFIMHIGILFLMRIDNYSFIMISTYFAFFTNKEYNHLTALLFRKWRKISDRFIDSKRSYSHV